MSKPPDELIARAERFVCWRNCAPDWSSLIAGDKIRKRHFERERNKLARVFDDIQREAVRDRLPKATEALRVLQASLLATRVPRRRDRGVVGVGDY